jgi:xanthine dehydrogenase small subunit
MAHHRGVDRPAANREASGLVIMGGGTDLMVQQPGKIAEQDLLLVSDQDQLRGIRREKDQISIGASATASDIMHSSVMEEVFPDIRRYFRLISSEPIRNKGTLAGNIVNASPIGDLSIFFLALDAILEIRLADEAKTPDVKYRIIALRDFFLGYKKLALGAAELMASLSFRVPAASSQFNFEKVSKRTHLDIASVNTAICVHTDREHIISCHISCGGVAPVPLYLKETSAFLSGQPLTVAAICEAESIVQQEISPISDVRGGADYKRLLARQLFFAHFLKLFPDRFHLRIFTEKTGSA